MALAAVPAPDVRCTVGDPRLAELSGLAVVEGSLWAMADGGRRIQLHRLDPDTCAVVDSRTATVDPYDAEDLAVGADGALWVGDTGDNDQRRDTVALIVVPTRGEPTLHRLTYPDGPHDAEALLLDHSGRPFIVTKEPLSSGVYTPDGPLSARRPTALRKVRTLSFGPTGTTGGPVGMASQVLVTGGAVSADGRLLVLRTYTDAYVWPAPDGDLEAALRTGDPRRIPLPATPQGEGVAVSPDGRALLTSTEGLPGRVHEVPLGDAAVVDAPTGGPDGPADSSTAAGERSWPDRLRPLTGPALGLAALAGLLLWLARRTRRSRL